MRSRAFLCLALLVAVASDTALAAARPEQKITSWLQSRLGAGGQESFIVLFDDPPSLNAVLARAQGGRTLGNNRNVYDALRFRARSTQAAVRLELTRAGIPFRPLYIINGLAVRGDFRLAKRIAQHARVVRIVGDPVVRGIDVHSLAALQNPAAPQTVEWGVARIEADKVWSLDGARGEGIVVASADTGVNWSHPALRGKYRGWNGVTADHDYNWFDPVDNTAAPFDDYASTHGTHTTGTMVGDDGAGNQIGVAPSADWIACRNMDHGNGQPSTYIACNQFFLAPYPHGGDPELDGDPSKAPDIVNNSWGCPPSEGCDATVLLSSFAALKAAGILAVVSAGNSGAGGCSTVSVPPAIYDESFVVGATDSSNTLAGFSSRGPVTLDGSGRLRPDVVAPGVAIRSSINTSSYGPLNGTSMAGPHAAGAAALLWSAKPQVRGLIRITRCLMTQSARSIVTGSPPGQTCGGTTTATRPNNMFGFGLIDAYDAIHFGPDGDADGIADACDCAASNGGAYETPPTVEGLRFGADKTTLSWTSIDREAGNGTIYQMARGDLDELRSLGGAVSAVTCLGGDTTESRSDIEIPLPGAGFYYLIGAENACGASGLGRDSAGTPRPTPACL